MADTIINTPSPNNGNDGSAGWVVALVIIIAVLVGGAVLYKKGYFSKQSGTTNINVTVPTGTGTGSATQ